MNPKEHFQRQHLLYCGLLVAQQIRKWWGLVFDSHHFHVRQHMLNVYLSKSWPSGLVKLAFYGVPIPFTTSVCCGSGVMSSHNWHGGYRCSSWYVPRLWPTCTSGITWDVFHSQTRVVVQLKQEGKHVVTMSPASALARTVRLSHSCSIFIFHFHHYVVRFFILTQRSIAANFHETFTRGRGRSVNVIPS